MNKFEFSRNKDVIKSVINDAEKFLNIVSFQFTDVEFIRNYILTKSAIIKIEILTLPEDSYSKPNEREEIVRLYKDLQEAGVQIHFCSWEIGDPSLTNTSQSGDEAEGGGSKWYSMHGKFMFSEKEALIMTSNFTESEELESYLRIQDLTIVEQFQKKFSYLKELFIKEGKYPGNLYDIVSEDTKEYIVNTYKTKTRLNILQYPPNIISNTISFDGLKIMPFDGRARDYLNKFIIDAQSFLYLSTQRLFDEYLIGELIKRKKSNPINIKIMTCPPSQIRDNQEKAEKMIIDLLSANIDIRFYNDIHAKCWISQNALGLGSINLGQMNLGINKSGGYWRANTETFYFTNDPILISEAKESFEEYFNDGDDPIISISRSNRHINEAKAMFSIYNIRSSKEAKETISLIKSFHVIKEQQQINKIVAVSVKIAQNHRNKRITKEEVLSALILFYLTDRKHDREELFEKMKPMISNQIEFMRIIQSLFLENLIEEQDGYIKINSERLIREI